MQYRRMAPSYPDHHNRPCPPRPPPHHHHVPHFHFHRGTCPNNDNNTPTAVPEPMPTPPGAFPLSDPNTSQELVDPPKPSRNCSRTYSLDSACRIPHRLSPPFFPRPPKLVPRSLYCAHALNLQRQPLQPLAEAFRPGGNRHCLHCQAFIGVTPGRAWEIVKLERVPRRSSVGGDGDANGCNGDGNGETTASTKQDMILERRFLVSNRFVVKCHRPGGGFVCVLCSRFCAADTVCRGVRALMEHVWEEHGVADLKAEIDIEEVVRDEVEGGGGGGDGEGLGIGIDV